MQYVFTAINPSIINVELDGIFFNILKKLKIVRGDLRGEILIVLG